MFHTKEQEKIKSTKVHVKPRKLARSVAHSEFKKQGYDNVDKPFFYKGHFAPSYFATHWRSIMQNKKNNNGKKH